MKTNPHRRHALAALAATAAIAASPFMASQAFAQAAYPNKPVTVVVSYPAGGDSDVLARLFAEKLTARFGQPFVVENRPGASGTIGNSFVAKAPADGHTLLFTPSTFSIAMQVLKPGSGASYDTLNDFTPIIKVGSQSLYMVASTTSGFTNVKSLVDAAKAGKVKGYGSPGSGSPMHVLGEVVNSDAGVKIPQIPYRGIAPSIIDLIGGHIPFVYTTLGSVQQHLANGKVVILAVADPKRSTFQSSVPTFVELGYKESVVGAWQALMGPKNMSPDVVRTLNTAMNDIMKAPDVVAKMTTLATTVEGGDPTVLTRVNAADYARFGKMIKDFGIQAD